jgi:tetratricopeptide (TPR) repeat protein
MEFEAGRYEQAAEIYRRLSQDEPSDASLYTSLAGCLGAMERYPEALAALEKGLELNPLNVEAHHNRAVIHERMGNTEAAVEDYKTAVRYSPSYEPSRKALIRLIGTAQLRSAATPAEQQASLLAEKASSAARRGAYDEAMAMLDEAARQAPGFVLVHQYRANVAFLMGDLELAEEALVAALRIEPENALFAKNLENVRQKRAQTGR